MSTLAVIHEAGDYVTLALCGLLATVLLVFGVKTMIESRPSKLGVSFGVTFCLIGAFIAFVGVVGFKDDGHHHQRDANIKQQLADQGLKVYALDTGNGTVTVGTDRCQVVMTYYQEDGVFKAGVAMTGSDNKTHYINVQQTGLLKPENGC